MSSLEDWLQPPDETDNDFCGTLNHCCGCDGFNNQECPYVDESVLENELLERDYERFLEAAREESEREEW